MFATQKQVIESFVRVRAFLEAHPVTGELTYRGVQETLDEVIDRFWVHAGTQISGQALARAELRRRERLITRLRDRHMRPIVTIARAQVEPHSEVRLPVAVRMPKVRIGVTKMLQACDGMMGAARAFEAVLIENGLPSDFLSRFKSDRDELELTFARRATLTGTHVGAKKGLQVVLARGRLAVDRLDAVVRVEFEGDEVVLATWRATKRVHQRPGGSSNQAPVGEDAREPVSEEVPQPIPVAESRPRLVA